MGWVGDILGDIGSAFAGTFGMFTNSLLDVWEWILFNFLVPLLVVFWILVFFVIQYYLIKIYIWLFKNLFSMLKNLIGKLILIPIVKEEINKLMEILDFSQTKKNEND